MYIVLFVAYSCCDAPIFIISYIFIILISLYLTFSHYLCIRKINKTLKQHEKDYQLPQRKQR